MAPALGWRYSYTDAEGVTTLVYANRNLLEAMTNPDSQSVTNSYDALRPRSGETDPEGT